MEIKGKILDEFGNPLSGAHITKFGNDSIGTFSAANGSFILNNSTIESFSLIKISFIGFYDKIFSAKELLLNPTIELKEETFNLNEVVVYDNKETVTKPKNNYTKPIIIVAAVGALTIGLVILKKALVWKI